MDTKTDYMHEWEAPFLKYRSYLISFAYRMTGSKAEAEDIVQDTYMECARVNPEDIQNYKSWLTKVCSNKGIDFMKSAHKRREAYPGLWLPDAVPERFQFWSNLTETESLDSNLVKTESLSTSSLLLIQKLSPEERVVYLLSDVFDYSFQEIGNFLNKTDEACRKIAQRARKAFENQKKYNPYSVESDELISRFFQVAKAGDAKALLELLSDDSEFWGDGGGKASVASGTIISDREKIAKFFSSLWSSKLYSSDSIKQESTRVNSRPGFIISTKNASGDWELNTIITFEISENKLTRIYAQRNPDKLNGLL